MKIASVDEMRAIDAAVITEMGITEEALMENAGLAALRLLMERHPGLPRLKTVIVCSSGNNGGDGFVLARQIHSIGGAAQVLLLGDAKKCRGAARANLSIISRIPTINIDTPSSKSAIQKALQKADIIVDALFGTGLDRVLNGLFLEAVRAINHSGKLVLSLDIPSGINGNTGEIMGEAVKADYTISFGMLKYGHLLFPGFTHCGEICLARISFPLEYINRPSLKIAINNYIALPARPPRAHKKSLGSALFVAGSDRYLGAPYLAAAAFLRSGGGYARLATVPSIIPIVAGKYPEIVFAPLPGVDGALCLKNLPAILALAQEAKVMVVGPGMSSTAEAHSLVLKLLDKARRPVVLDGDAIGAFASAPEILQKRNHPTIITPHSGELGRFLGIAGADIEKRRLDVLRSACRTLNAHIVLKGAHSLIGCPDGRVFVNLSGNAGMATAGTGDVLTGVIAALYGLGLSIEEALCKAVYLHGLAGDIAKKKKGEEGMIAGDVLENLPEAIVADRAFGKNIPAIAVI